MVSQPKVDPRGGQLALAKSLRMEVGNVWCVAPQVLLPLPRLAGLLLCEYPLDSAQLSTSLRTLSGATHQHEQFLTLRFLVNKTLLSCSLHLHSLFKLHLQPYHIHLSLIPSTNQKIPLPIPLWNAPLHSLPHCLHRAPFQLLLTLGGFRTRI